VPIGERSQTQEFCFLIKIKTAVNAQENLSCLKVSSANVGWSPAEMPVGEHGTGRFFSRRAGDRRCNINPHTVMLLFSACTIRSGNLVFLVLFSIFFLLEVTNY
jgi:hypothetical protein